MFDLSQISVPIIILLPFLGIYLLFFLFYGIFNIYHLLRYGVYGFGLYLIVTIFAGGTILMIFGSLSLLSQYNWSSNAQLNNVIDINNSDLLLKF